MTRSVLGGLYVPIVTPFDDRDRVALDVVERLSSECLDAGAAGIVALATTGEATSLTNEERDAIVATCADACRDRGAQLLVGAGTNDTRTTVERHHALADVPGVTGSLAVVPYYVRPSEAAIVDHFRFVAERSPVPVVLYNVPYRTGRGLGADALLELAATPNIVGVKQAVGAIDADTLDLLRQAPEDFAVLGGDDAFLLPLVLMGAAGAIAASANICTTRFVTMINRGLTGDLDTARAQAEALLPLAFALFAEPSPAVTKGVLHALGRIPTPAVRMPLAPASIAAVTHAMTIAHELQ